MSNNSDKYDVIIVGAGISGSIIAKELARKCKDKSILILEAGTGKSSDFMDYEASNDRFYNAGIKVPNSPYQDTPFAPSPSVLDPQRFSEEEKLKLAADKLLPKDKKKATPKTNGYFVQYGPYPFLSNYNRNVGGTTLHWLGTTPRMCPNDFKMKSVYGKGVDWPISYEELMPYYRRAEHEIGVSAEVVDQAYKGIHFKDEYVFPMHRMPQSYMDEFIKDKLENKRLNFNDTQEEIEVVSTPQGRNGMPNANYKLEEQDDKITGYQPVGAVGNPDLGQRCEGNSNCVPICPVQAKYSALKSLDAALKSKTSKVQVLSQAPVSHIEVDPETNEITKVHYKTYEFSEDGRRTNIQSHWVAGKVVVLAANAIENAKLLLASDACKTSDQVGRNLMDHLVMLTWGFLPKEIGAYRGPGSTSGIPFARDGEFRKEHSAFWIELGNWGWSWPAGAPDTFLTAAVDGTYPVKLYNMLFGTQLEKPIKLKGEKLVQFIQHYTNRQFRIGWEIEQLPHPDNRVTICKDYKDDLGNHRPVINYELTDYEKKGGQAAAETSKQLFEFLEVTSPEGLPVDLAPPQVDENNPGYFEYKEGEEVFKGVFNGAGHVVGCHRMGDDAKTSVVDSHQKAHDHPNLFVTGAGSFPTLATSNPTLTLSALAMRTADAIQELL